MLARWCGHNSVVNRKAILTHRPVSWSPTTAYAAQTLFQPVARALSMSSQPTQQYTDGPPTVGNMSQSALHLAVPEVVTTGPAAAVPSAASNDSLGGWSHAMMAYYLAADRNWKAVEDFYIRLVSGTACLSQLGQAPAGAPAAASTAGSAAAAPVVTTSVSNAHAAQHGQQEDKAIISVESEQQMQQRKKPNERRTYKVWVSYFGSSFAGWARQPNRKSVEGTVAAAVAAAGLTGGSAGDKNSKRAAARAARRAEKKAKNTAGDASDAAAGPAGALSHDVSERLSSALQAPDATPGSAADGHNSEQKNAASGAAQGGNTAAEAAAAVSSGPVAGAGGVVPLPVISVGGRTDAGVTAVGQVISFHRYGAPICPDLLLQQFNAQLAAVMQEQETALQSSNSKEGANCAAGHDAGQVADVPALAVSSQLRGWSACEVSRQFHATFSANWRRYVYLLPLRQHQHQHQHLLVPGQGTALPAAEVAQLLPQYNTEIQQALQGGGLSDGTQKTSVQRAPDVDPGRVNMLLQQLQGRALDYYAYARDTPKAKECLCILHMARASVVHVPINDMIADKTTQPANGIGGCSASQQHMVDDMQPCLCIELVGDRFLRRMVRVLVATAVRESLLEAADVRHQTIDSCVGGYGSGVEAVQPLVELAGLCDRNKTAAAAPGLGLCFAAVGYDE